MPDTALLVMDVQRGLVARFPDDTGLLPRINTAIAAARAASLPVIYVVMGFRANRAEINPHNKVLSAFASSVRFTPDDPAAEIHPDIAPTAEDTIVTKRRVSAFSGSDLDVVLRSKRIDSLVLTGIATSGVVLSTLRLAADLDYRLTVLEDACLDPDPEVHTILTTKIFPRQADVLSVNNWTASL